MIIPTFRTLIATTIAATLVAPYAVSAQSLSDDNANLVKKVTISETGTLIADGKSAVQVTVHAVDANGDAVPSAQVEVTVLTGNATLAPRGSTTPNASDLRQNTNHRIDAHTDKTGDVKLLLTPGIIAGPIQLAVTAGSVTASQAFTAAPFLRQPIVVGLINGGIGTMPAAVDGDDQFDNGGSRRSRIALFGMGNIGDGALGTFAYDTASRLTPTNGVGPNVDDPSARTYATYGDASVASNGPQSTTRLFARVEKGANSLQYGTFRATTTSGNDADSFSARLNGLNLQLSDQTGSAKLAAFVAQTPVAFGRASFNPLGLSAAGEVLEPAIIVGSENVTLVAVSRVTGAVISEQPMTRNVDYALDYPSGMLRFINIPLPFDATGNPQVVLVRYEYLGTGNGAWTTGGNVRVGTNDAHVAAGYVNNSSQAGTFTLLSENVGGKILGFNVNVAHANTNGGFNVLSNFTDAGSTGAGDTWKLSADAGTDATGRVSAQWQTTSDGYANPFGSLATPGLTDYRVSYTHTLGNKATLTASYDGQSTTAYGVDARQQNASLNLKQPLNPRLTASLGLVEHTSSGENGTVPSSLAGMPNLLAPVAMSSLQNVDYAGGTTLQGTLGLDWRASDRLSISANRLQDLSGIESAIQPGQTNAQVSYKMGSTGTAYVREYWNDVAAQTFSGATSSYTGVAEGTGGTVFGVEQALSPATTVESSYTVDRTASGSNAYSALGIKEKLHFSEMLNGSAFAQFANTAGYSNATATSFGPGTSGANSAAGAFGVYGVQLAYNDHAYSRASASFQTRSGYQGGSSYSIGGAGKIATDVSILGNISDTSIGGYTADTENIGLAWRPSNNERGAGLLGWERNSGSAFSNAPYADVLSYDQLYRPTSRLELSGRLAYKLDGDAYYAPHTSLYALRGIQRVGGSFDLGAEIQHISSADLSKYDQNAFSLEGGYRAANSLRVALGYHFDGAVDPALAAEPTRRGMYLSVTSLVDRLFGWGLQH